MALLRSAFGVDPRSLALYRAALAACVLLDLALRAFDLTAHYGDDGVYPRGALLEQYAKLLGSRLCLHLAIGSVGGQALFFLVHAGAALALLSRYARPAAALCWLLTYSLQSRTPFILYGADDQLRMLLLWAMFLPAPGAARAQGQPLLSLGTTASLLQIAFVVFGAGLNKLTHAAWQTGEAMARTLDQDLVTRPLGMWLGQFDGLVQPASWLLVAIELAAPLLLFAGRYGRALGIAAIVALHLGFAATLRVGLFPVVGIATLALFVPGSWWGGAARPAAEARPGSAAVETAWSVVCALLLVLNVAVAVGEHGPRSERVRAALQPPSEALFLAQAWRMFSRLPSATGTLLVEGKTRDGAAVDLLSAGGPLPSVKTRGSSPEGGHRLFHSTRWLGFFLRCIYMPAEQQSHFLQYGRYLCRNWNAQVLVPGEQLVGFDMIYLHRPYRSVTEAPQPTRHVLWTHWCFG